MALYKYNIMKGYNRDTIKLSYIGEPKYYINEKKRTVTCSVMAILIGPNIARKGWMWQEGVNFQNKELSFTSTARCHANDVFDIEKGKRIALSKAENGLYSLATSVVSSVCEDLDGMREACNDFVKKSIKCQAHNIDYIDSLTMPAHPNYKEGPFPEKRGTIVEHIK